MKPQVHADPVDGAHPASLSSHAKIALPVELRNVRAFLAVADHRHFGRAAVELHITQPGLTQRIQVLERELGTQLLQRSSREVRLTAGGRVFLPHARRLTQEEDRAQREIRDYRAGITGRLRLSYLTAWTVGLPASIVSEFRRSYPAVQLVTTSGQSRSNMTQVAVDQLDLAFVAVPAGKVEGVTVRSINRQEILIVMSPVNPLAKMDRVPIDFLRGEPIIAVSSATKSPHVDAARKWLEMRLGEEPNIVAEEPPDQIPAAVAQSGVAIAFTTESRAAAMSAAGLTCRRISPAPMVEYGVAYRQGVQSTTTTNMLQIVDTLAPELGKDLPSNAELVWTADELDHASATN